MDELSTAEENVRLKVLLGTLAAGRSGLGYLHNHRRAKEKIKNSVFNMK